MRARSPWSVMLALSVACESGAPVGAPATSAAACRRAYGEKLGVPFVRICPDDLPGVITEPFWIAAAPVGCPAGEHAALRCPPIVALQAGATGSLEPRTAAVIDAAAALRTCGMRFGGRLATASERAQARDALGLSTVVVTASAQPRPRLRYRALAEWTTARPCTEPSTLGSACDLEPFPDGASAALAWDALRACSATAMPAAGALVVELGDECPGSAPRGACLVAAPTASPARRAVFALDCQVPAAEQLVHPSEPAAAVAAFRCVVPEAALVGTVTPAP